jgi:hypothetical protein
LLKVNSGSSKSLWSVEALPGRELYNQRLPRVHSKIVGRLQTPSLLEIQVLCRNFRVLESWTARELLDVVGAPPPGLSPQWQRKQLTCSIRITEMEEPDSMQLLRARDCGVCGGGRYRGISLGWCFLELAGLRSQDEVPKGPPRELRLRKVHRSEWRRMTNNLAGGESKRIWDGTTGQGE